MKKGRVYKSTEFVRLSVLPLSVSSSTCSSDCLNKEALF